MKEYKEEVREKVQHTVDNLKFLLYTLEYQKAIHQELVMLLSKGLGIGLNKEYINNATVLVLIEDLKSYLKVEKGVEIDEYSEEELKESYKSWDLEEDLVEYGGYW
jgi:hypothetical protein